tara:strand:- start:72 stop:479 length:408 start_codon:yes stop_codon:yes gene_type:complete
MSIQFLSDSLFKGELTVQKVGVTNITAAPGNTHNINFALESNNYSISANNATNVITFVNLSADLIGKQGNITITNPSSVGSLGWSVLPSTAYTPGGGTINFDTTANGIAVISYFILAANKVLINYVGNFDSYPQP